jgi:hypothetical protein
MKKIYLSILSVALVSGLNAQIKQTSGPIARSNDRTEAKPNVQETNVEKAVTIWESTFDTPSEWVIDHDAADCSLDWEIGMNSCGGSYPIDDIASTSVNDGWAMIDSDEYGGTSGGSEVEDSWLTMANSVDLTSYPNVVVEFETQYRRYNSERPFVVVGFGDGTGPASVVWPNLDPTFDPSTDVMVYDAFPNWANSAASDNPQLIQVNISPALVGATPTQLANVYVRLNWTGTWGYAWFVDDFKIIEQPANDVQTVAAWISGENNDGVEYGRNPDNQMDANWYVGANVFNFGINDQTNVSMTADFVTFSSSGNDPLLEADSTVTLETLESPTLTTGTYTGTYTTVSDDETGGAAFGNNVSQRVFEVTSSPQQLYSTDGIDVYPPADLDLTSLGTNSFNISVPGSEDGLVLASMYHIKTPTVVSGIQVMLADGTVEGGEIYGSLKDTASFWASDMTSLINAQPVTVTATDITNGYVYIMFDSPYSLTPGEYYAAVELYSNGNSSDIRVVDDRTVDQPYFTASIYLPGDASYSNGTALGIRMLMGADWIGLDENTLDGVSIYPNPSEGLVNISNDNSVENTIIVHDLAGRQIMSTTASSATTIDLSANGTGVYTVTVANENGSVVERIIIK